MKEKKAKLVPIIILLGSGIALGVFFYTWPDWTFWQLGKFLLAFIVSLVFGLFANAQIFLPILYNLPRSIYLYSSGRLRFAGILWQFIAPVSWLLGAFIFGFVAPSAVNFLTSSMGFNFGMGLSTIAILLSLVTPSGLNDLKTDYEKNSFARFGKIHQTGGVPGHDVFNAASDNYSTADDAIQSYTTRANHRYAITTAQHDQTLDTEAYNETVAAYTDPADFAPYTEADLDAHTAAMENLTAAFDTLTSAFAALNPTHDLYALADNLYKVYCETYSFAADAYSNAAHCATVAALEGNLLAAKDDFKAGLLEARANNPNETDPVAAKARAAAFKAKVTEDAIKAKALEQKARVAETKAKEFLAKVEASSTKCSEA